MSDNTKVRLYCAVLGACVGYFATPYIVEKSAKAINIARKVADRLTKRVL